MRTGQSCDGSAEEQKERKSHQGGNAVSEDAALGARIDRHYEDLIVVDRFVRTVIVENSHEVVFIADHPLGKGIIDRLATLALAEHGISRSHIGTDV